MSTSMTMGHTCDSPLVPETGDNGVKYWHQPCPEGQYLVKGASLQESAGTQCIPTCNSPQIPALTTLLLLALIHVSLEICIHLVTILDVTLKKIVIVSFTLEIMWTFVVVVGTSIKMTLVKQPVHLILIFKIKEAISGEYSYVYVMKNSKFLWMETAFNSHANLLKSLIHWPANADAIVQAHLRWH